MRLIANHRLVEDFIDSLDVKELQPEQDVKAEKYQFSYIFEYSFSKQKVWDKPDTLYFMFQKIVHVLSGLRHIEELGLITIKIEDSKYSKDEEEFVVDAQSFRVLIDSYAAEMKQQNFYSSTPLALDIMIQFNAHKVSYERYVKEINKMHKLLMYDYRHETMNPDSLSVADNDSWDSPIWICSDSALTQQLEIKNAYTIIFSEVPEELNYKDFYRIVYRAQYRQLMLTLMWMKDNTDVFKGYFTQPDGFRQKSNDDNTWTFKIYVTMIPTERRYEEPKKILENGARILKGIGESDLHDLRSRNIVGLKSWCTLYIRTSSEVFSALRPGEDILEMNGVLDPTINARVILCDNNYKMLHGETAFETVEMMQNEFDRFQKTCDKEKENAEKQNRR